MPGRRAIPACFKAYDIRGRVPDELDDDLAYRIGLATAIHLRGGKFVVGRDCRLSSEGLAAAVIRGLTDAGSDVVDVGLCGTEMVYYTTYAHGLAGGIMVTASHNPMDHNGMKLVREDSRPISGDSGLHEIGAASLTAEAPAGAVRGTVTHLDVLDEYVGALLDLADTRAIGPLKVVADGGNGCAGPVVAAFARRLPCTCVPLPETPAGNFPPGIPNPLLPENRAGTAKAVREHGADLGLAWDGDFDRCFFFDENGDFIEGYYLVGMLAEAALRRHPGSRIIHDPRLTWNTVDLVTRAGGVPVMSKTGHAFIKERMRKEDAVYGGEMSAHHYFRDFAYCDSGMLPWLWVLGEISRSGRPLSELVRQRQAAYPASGEINRRLVDPDAALAAIRRRYLPDALGIDETDGLSCDMGDWRFNLRNSNTEPVIRLNVESRGDVALMREMTAGILALLDA